jgi:UDP:flavonoid glycosyltransferase YjiC (YdhE family)
MTPLGLPPLKRLAEIYRADASLPVGIRLLDPYVDARSEPRVAPDVGGIPAGGYPRERQEVFVYLSTTDRSDPAMLDFLRLFKVPARLYVANADAATLARFRATGVIVEERPVAPSDIARRSRVLVHAGNHGTMCLGIRAGIPQVSVPQQLEQMFNARRLERTGAGRTVGWSPRTGELYAKFALDLYEDAGAQERARQLAEVTAADFAGDARAQSVARILETIR